MQFSFIITIFKMILNNIYNFVFLNDNDRYSEARHRASWLPSSRSVNNKSEEKKSTGNELRQPQRLQAINISPVKCENKNKNEV